ncbi:HAD family hydrolase [bacterium]|nr:HAD family hydrolase [bacterium]
MNKMIGIKAISFDGDGTLWDFNKVMRHSLHHVLKELKQIDPHAAAMLDIELMIKIRNRVAAELKGRVTNLERIRIAAFRQTLEDIGRPNDALASRLNEVYLKHRFEDIELFDDVLPSLEALREKYTIGLLSNGNSYPEPCGLDGMFQFTVFSQDYGVEKPDRKLFQITLKKAMCTEQQLLHIGDSLHDDIAGAGNSGIRSIWLNRKQLKNSTGIRADYEIASLSELLV